MASEPASLPPPATPGDQPASPPRASEEPDTLVATGTVTTPRIKKISLSGFRAFPPYKPKSLEIDLGGSGKNLLLYGENGSGKTSLFRSLRDLFDVSPHPRNYEDCRNIFHQDEDDSIAVELTSGNPSEYRWEVGEAHPKTTGGDSFHEFARRCLLLEYRDLLQTNFVHRTGAPNLFDLLVKVVLPELPAPTRPLKELHEAMRAAIPQGRQTKNPVRWANIRASALRDALANHLPELIRESNRLLASLHSRTAIQLSPPSAIIYNKAARDYDGQALTLSVELNGRPITEPQHFLNEARLTAIALAIYLASARLTRSGRPGVMVLDDVLIGLDLSNRIPLLQLLQTEFGDWQILLLTHDHTWFELAREYTKASGHWIDREMFLVEPEIGGLGRPELRDGLCPLKRAEAHLRSNDLMAAAVYLRAAFEARIRGVCEDHGVPVSYKKRPQDAKADLLWGAIKQRQEVRKKKKDEEPGKNHPDFIPPTLVQKVDLMRSKILNRLSHAGAPTFERSELEGARDTLRELQSHSFPDANP
jgi:energy-coupling factor transporter ATP-binding protein EcfA2